LDFNLCENSKATGVGITYYPWSSIDKVAFSFFQMEELAPNARLGAKWDPDEHPDPAVIEEGKFHSFTIDPSR